MYLSHTDVSFPLFLPPFPSKINKENLLNKNLVPIDEGTKVAFILLSHKGGFSLVNVFKITVGSSSEGKKYLGRAS